MSKERLDQKAFRSLWLTCIQLSESMIKGKASRTHRNLGLDAHPHVLEGTWVLQKAFGRGKRFCLTQLRAAPKVSALLTCRAGRETLVVGICCIVGCLSGLKLSSKL
jgi:hypothetical protein